MGACAMKMIKFFKNSTLFPRPGSKYWWNDISTSWIFKNEYIFIHFNIYLPRIKLLHSYIYMLQRNCKYTQGAIVNFCLKLSRELNLP